MGELPEPWLRGPLTDVHPLIMPVFFSFAQAEEDLSQHISPLTDEQAWQPFGGVSIGFQLKHIAGSVDRLSTYLLGMQLDQRQLSYLQEEHVRSATLMDLLSAVGASFSTVKGRLRKIDPAEMYRTRTVGRQELPTTVIGLLTHLAEHTQRHVGQAITLSQVLRQMG